MPELTTHSGDLVLVDADIHAELSGHTLYTHRSHDKTYALVALPQADGSVIRVGIHRYITKAPNGRMVDHKDGDGLNNYRSNLRVATRSQNAVNQPLRRKGSSRFRGVFLVKKSNRWLSQIRVDNKARYLGTYDSQEYAARAYDRAAIEAFGEFAVLNFPTEDYSNDDVPEYQGRPRSSKYRGVSRDASSGKWQASFTNANLTTYLGQYPSEDDAARAYDEAACSALGSHARLNFPAEAGASVVGNEPVRTSSAYTGVNPSGSRIRPWRAVICVGGELMHIGSFATEEDAARAYDEVARQNPGQRRRKLNFP